MIYTTGNYSPNLGKFLHLSGWGVFFSLLWPHPGRVEVSQARDRICATAVTKLHPLLKRELLFLIFSDNLCGEII